MSRRRAQSGPTISLFPFLAVLLCTMGALLVLLVLFSSSAERADSAAEAEATRQQVEELELARDEFAWRLGQLAGVRSRTADQLAKARMQLAGIEEHARALVDELEQLGQTADALAAPPTAAAADESSVEDLERHLADARGALEAARADAADRPPAYAVVPYEGASGTHRRPLYIECCIDGVFLQPEGIQLRPADFEGPPGPGNPLASALRAAREYLANRPGESGEPSLQPYPLLLVRPSGVMAYYAARESLQSWGSDFGYQFIDEDWTLAYPPADPALADVERRAIEESRRRLEWLAQVRPQKRTRPAVQYRASNTRGGVVSSEGPSVLGDQSRFDWTEQQAAAAAGRGFRADGNGGSGQGDAVLGNGNGNGNGDPAAAPGGNGGSGAGSGGNAGDRYLGPAKFYGGSGQGQAGDQANGDGAAGGNAESGSDGLAAGSLAAGADGRAAAGGADGGAAAGTAGGEGGDASAGAGDLAGTSSAAGGSAGGAAGGSAAQGGSASASGGGSAAGASGGGGGSFGPALPGMAEGQAGGAGSSPQDCADGTCSMAGRRGSNWASLATGDRPIPLTRPLRLECSANEFRLLGNGGRVTARVAIPSRTADAIDPLVREVHTVVGGWGMAGDRMSWKPELVLTATPDGINRRDELEQLLADSGLDTRRADEGDAVRSLPPVQRTGGVFRSR